MDIQNFIDQLREVFFTLEKNKLRSCLTGLTVSWGIFMLILLLGSGYGLEKGVRHAFEEDAVNSLWINPGQTSLPYQGLNRGRQIRFRNPDVEALARSVPETERISGRFFMSGNTIVRFKKKTGRFQVVGVDPAYAAIENFVIRQGRALNRLDESRTRKKALLGTAVQQELFPRGSGVGAYILIRGVPFQVVGVFDDPGDQWTLDRIFIPMSAMQTVFNRDDSIHNIAMTITPGDRDRAGAVEERVRETIAARHRFAVQDRRALFTHNTLKEYTQLMDLFANIRAFIWIIGLGSVVSGIVSISNIMLITVKERTREIGIRKALGETPGAVVRTILMESVLLTLGFGYFGLVAGVGLLEIMGNLVTGIAYFSDPQVNMGVAVGALMLLVVSGTLAGIFPARQAAAIRPAVALRDD